MGKRNILDMHCTLLTFILLIGPIDVSSLFPIEIIKVAVYDESVAKKDGLRLMGRNPSVLQQHLHCSGLSISHSGHLFCDWTPPASCASRRAGPERSHAPLTKGHQSMVYWTARYRVSPLFWCSHRMLSGLCIAITLGLAIAMTIAVDG